MFRPPHFRGERVRVHVPGPLLQISFPRHGHVRLQPLEPLHGGVVDFWRGEEAARDACHRFAREPARGRLFDPNEDRGEQVRQGRQRRHVQYIEPDKPAEQFGHCLFQSLHRRPSGRRPVRIGRRPGGFVRDFPLGDVVDERKEGRGFPGPAPARHERDPRLAAEVEPKRGRVPPRLLPRVGQFSDRLGEHLRQPPVGGLLRRVEVRVRDRVGFGPEVLVGHGGLGVAGIACMLPLAAFPVSNHRPSSERLKRPMPLQLTQTLRYAVEPSGGVGPGSPPNILRSAGCNTARIADDGETFSLPRRFRCQARTPTAANFSPRPRRCSVPPQAPRNRSA